VEERRGQQPEHPRCKEQVTLGLVEAPASGAVWNAAILLCKGIQGLSVCFHTALEALMVSSSNNTSYLKHQPNQLVLCNEQALNAWK